MSDESSFKDRVTRQGEETIGKLAQELLENPMVSGALSAAFETRERAMRAQEVAMGALNLPSASDLERLTRRIRSVSQRLEGIEDGLDRLDDRLERAGNVASLDERLARIEASLERLEASAGQAPAAPKPARKAASSGGSGGSETRTAARKRADAGE
jgi:predicted  nucleic acid-binding Zn-ribbon protein